MTDPANPVPLVELAVEFQHFSEWWKINAGTRPLPPIQSWVFQLWLAAPAHSTAALSAIPVPVEVQDLCERLGRSYPTDFELRFGLINPDGPEAATALAQQATTIAALTAENDELRVADRDHLSAKNGLQTRFNDATDQIAALTASLEQARDALEPFTAGPCTCGAMRGAVKCASCNARAALEVKP